MAGPRIVVVGSANMDLVGNGARLPKPGETVLGHEFVMVPGGKGANQAIAAARAGGSCAFLGALGSDSFGVTIKARLEASGVDTTQTRVAYGASGVAIVMVDDPGENSIMVLPGANSQFVGLGPDETAVIEGADVLLLQLEIPLDTVTAAARAARAAGTRVVLNAAPSMPLPDDLLAATDLLVVNEVEQVGVAGVGREDPGAMLGAVPRVVLTVGADGAWYAERDSAPVHVPAFRVTAVDSTAAGDAFVGALGVAWGEGRDLVDAVRWANAAGAACTRRLGASVALPARAEIDELYSAA
jgi:ribokinase